MSRLVPCVLAAAVAAAACSDTVNSPVMPSALGRAMSVDTGTALGDPDVAAGGVRTSEAKKPRREVEGLIESLPPTQPANTLVVRGETILTDASTVIREGDLTKSFADLAVGMLVHVRGVTTGSQFLASRIVIQNTIGKPVNVKGTVADLSGTAADFEFMLGTRSIHGDSATRFTGGKSPSFASLVEGARVEVKGQQRDGFVYATRIHVKKSGRP